MVLLEDRDALARGDDDLARVRLQLPGENFQELALARAVCADDAVAVALVKLDVHVLKKNPLPKLERNIACLYHFLFLPTAVFCAAAVEYTIMCLNFVTGYYKNLMEFLQHIPLAEIHTAQIIFLNHFRIDKQCKKDYNEIVKFHQGGLLP